MGINMQQASHSCRHFFLHTNCRLRFDSCATGFIGRRRRWGGIDADEQTWQELEEAIRVVRATRNRSRSSNNRNDQGHQALIELYDLAAQKARAENDEAKALGYFQAEIAESKSFIAAYPRHAVTDSVMLGLGAAYEHIGDKKSAIATYETLIGQFPRSSLVPSVRSALGALKGAKGTWDKVTEP